MLDTSLVEVMRGARGDFGVLLFDCDVSMLAFSFGALCINTMTMFKYLYHMSEISIGVLYIYSLSPSRAKMPTVLRGM